LVTEDPQTRTGQVRKPAWLKRRLPTGPVYEDVRHLLKEGRLHTVCQEAKCPNLWECFSTKTATFLIMGSRCTRNCRFCAVPQGPLGSPDPNEPSRIAEAVETMALRYVVVTSVTRDDLSDGGASCFAKTIKAIRRRTPEAMVEVLIPDFQGDQAALRTVLDARKVHGATLTAHEAALAPHELAENPGHRRTAQQRVIVAAVSPVAIRFLNRGTGHTVNEG